MDLEGYLTDPELSRSLLVKEAADDQRQHVPLSGRQRRIALQKHGHLGTPKPRFAVLSQTSLHSVQQIIVAERFGKKVHRAALDRANRRWDVPVAGNKDDRRVTAFGDLLLQIQAVDVRQLHIEDQARRYVRL